MDTNGWCGPWSHVEGYGKGIQVLALALLASLGGNGQHGWQGQWLVVLQGPALGTTTASCGGPHRSRMAPSTRFPCRLPSRGAWCRPSRDSDRTGLVRVAVGELLPRRDATKAAGTRVRLSRSARVVRLGTGLGTGLGIPSPARGRCRQPGLGLPGHWVRACFFLKEKGKERGKKAKLTKCTDSEAGAEGC